MSVTTRIAMIRERFGRAHFGTILGATFGIMMLGVLGGPPIAGWVYDTFGSYRGAWLSYSGVALMGIILVLTIPPARRSRP